MGERERRRCTACNEVVLLTKAGTIPRHYLESGRPCLAAGLGRAWTRDVAMHAAPTSRVIDDGPSDR